MGPCAPKQDHKVSKLRAVPTQAAPGCNAPSRRTQCRAQCTNTGSCPEERSENRPWLRVCCKDVGEDARMLCCARARQRVALPDWPGDTCLAPNQRAACVSGNCWRPINVASENLLGFPRTISEQSTIFCAKERSNCFRIFHSCSAPFIAAGCGQQAGLITRGDDRRSSISDGGRASAVGGITERDQPQRKGARGRGARACALGAASALVRCAAGRPCNDMSRPLAVAGRPTELEVHTYSKEPPPAGWASFECTGPAALAGFADYLRRGPKVPCRMCTLPCAAAHARNFWVAHSWDMCTGAEAGCL